MHRFTDIITFNSKLPSSGDCKHSNNKKTTVYGRFSSLKFQFGASHTVQLVWTTFIIILLCFLCGASAIFRCSI